MMKYLVLAAAAVSLAAPSFAQQTPPTPEERAARFDAADANKDGQVTAEERKAQRGAWRAKRGVAAPAAPANE